MCDVCADFLHLLVSYETRITNNDAKHTALLKKEIETAYGYISAWSQRQCMCLYRDAKNFERFNLIIQSMICLMLHYLKNIKKIIVEYKTTTGDNTNYANNNASQNDSIENRNLQTDCSETSTKDNEDNIHQTEDRWMLREIDKLVLLVSKAFLLNFPLYLAYKHGVHSRLDELSAEEAQHLSGVCDLHDNDVPVYLLRNVTLFCNSGGFSALMECFENDLLPVTSANALTILVSNIKLWLNYRCIIQLFVPLRIKVLLYMCQLSDQSLRSQAARAMADFVWSSVRDPLDSSFNFDIEGLQLALKYFNSTTLTMRLAGMAQINAHINLFNEICTTETVGEIEVVGQKLGDWLTENQIIQHLFGPNLHVEVIKQAHVVLNFLAVENQITEEHVNLIWQAAQLKHCSKPIYDILPSLVKNFAVEPALHMHLLLCRLDPKEHTEQSIYIASILTKLMWCRDSTRPQVDLTTDNLVSSNVTVSSSENSISVDGSNSEEDHPDDTSSSRRSPIDIEGGSDSGAPPCKQPRRKKSDVDIGNKGKSQHNADIVPIKIKSQSPLQIKSRDMANSSSDEDVPTDNFRKKVRSKIKNNNIPIRLPHELVEAIWREESHSEGDAINDSDCSDTHVQTAVLKHLHGDGPYIRAIAETHISELLSGAENDESYSSPMSNKSEKNMADFDDEDSHCEEEIAQLVSRSNACIPGFSIPLAMRGSKQNDALKSTAVDDTGGLKGELSETNKSANYSAFKINDVCQPGKTLLWDLLQDDKIGHLGESLALEAEKVLGTLLCFSSDRLLRTKFIEGCLLNLATNKTVIVSLRLLPKLFSSFHQFRTTDTHQVTIWAERQHKMMFHFFNNIKHYSNLCKNLAEVKPILGQNGTPMYSHMTQVSVRLHFLSSIYSSVGSPKSFRLTIDQVDALWDWLARDPECADCLFAWLQCQAKGVEPHSLSIEALQHLYLKKLPELRPEEFSMVALGLFQQLCSLARLAIAHYEKQTDSLSNSSANIVGMSHLWKIALRAHNTEVSLAAIQYINSYYMGQQLRMEHEFVSTCMDHLQQAAEDLKSSENQDHALMCIQRGLMLLNTHLDTFRRRYAFHLRRWTLEGKGVGSHSSFRSNSNGPSIRIVLQPAGLSEKTILHMHLFDLIAELKAEISKWWETVQGEVKTSEGSAPVLGLLLSEGPLRIITQGQELTPDYDERTLSDVGFKDNQIVYVSLGGRGVRRKEAVDHPTFQPPPQKECLPTIILLQPVYFEELFRLMRTLGEMKLLTKSDTLQHHTKAQLLSRRVWEILSILPTNPTLLELFKSLKDDLYESENGDFAEADRKMAFIEEKLDNLLDPNNLQKFMYSLNIVESLAIHSKQSECCTDTKKDQHKTRLDSSSMKSKTSINIRRSIDEIVEDKSKYEENPNSTEVEDLCEPNSYNSIDNYSEERNLNTFNCNKWLDVFIKCGGMKHLYNIFLSGILQSSYELSECYNEWRHDCLASLLRVICILGFEEIRPDDLILVIPSPHPFMSKMMNEGGCLERLSSVLKDEAQYCHYNKFQLRTGFWGRAQVVQFTMNIMVCFVHSSKAAQENIWSNAEYCNWLQKFVLDDPEPAVRREICAGLYRISLGNSRSCHELLTPLIHKLVSFLPVAENMTNQHPNPQLVADEGKEPYGPACRDYFWLLARLVDTLTPEFVKECLEDPQEDSIDIERLCRQISQSIMERPILETRHGCQDDSLVGLVNLLSNLVKYDPPYKSSSEALHFIGKLFEFLFDLPSPQNRQKPKCKSQTSRAAVYDLLVELCKSCPANFTFLHGKLLEQHKPGPHTPYPWDYWPRDDGRSDCGYVGLANLGATCYMASCIQHLYMMPQARETILMVPPDGPMKHAQTLQELQRMFAYLMESERKSYNPRSFCRVYQMDHQPLNTGEQKDMAEFFIDLVSKLEEMTPELKILIKRLFCGTLSNNVVSLDCGHVSRTAEEFYTVRCQVADMRNLQESLDEVTVKDTLEGDNMYTCSQCGKKVRAEKRACFKKLPQILCFNTMRYTFNMITMLKEKVNTHFSFPMRLDMSDYVEKTLMPHQELEIRNSEKSTSSNDDTDRTVAGNTNLDTNETNPNIGKTYECYDDIDKEDEFSECYEYELVGVTVHTGNADGGHYYSFIKERISNASYQERWFLFNDAEVKQFDPSQIAAECFGGEMTSKTYDSVTEKYLDFSFEKSNSAYMLFYERRLPQHLQVHLQNLLSVRDCSSDSPVVGLVPNIASSSLYQSTSNETDNNISSYNNTESLIQTSSLGTTYKCDIDIKGNHAMKSAALPTSSTSSSVLISNQPSDQNIKGVLSNDLEEWIWKDNRNFLQDRNIFEHTYFNFMWQVCGHIPQTLLIQNDVTCMAAQLSVSFFIETFIHAKEKPTMVLWVELLTKQFNASKEACEWFLTHMSTEPWWPVQVLIQCPNQMVRQMFQRLVIHVIQRLRPMHYTLYLQADSTEDRNEVIGNASCITRFIKSLIVLLENGAKAHLRHLSEFFGLLYEFARMGDEETLFLLRINIIRSVADFYLGNKSQECTDNSSDNDENSSDELSVDKSRPASLDKMIALVATLVERSRGSDFRLHLSPKDYNAIAGGKGFPFLYQQIKDNINPHQSRHLIHALCRWDERLANQIISMLFASVAKHLELCGPFFKLLSLLTETQGGPSGLPCFSQLILQRVWDAAQYCPQSALDWLAVQAPRNKIAHAWILQSAESWVEQFLMAHNNSRVRNAASYLLVSLVPSQTFRSNFRAHSLHKFPAHISQRELSSDAQLILHGIIVLLLQLLRPAKAYADIGNHGTTKLTAYFSLLTYCMVSKTEKLMLGPYMRALWDLFHPRLSEPSVPAHHNKHSLLAFWHHATTDCPENAIIVATCAEITRNIAFNYILADHDDSEIVAYNRAMLPAYYGLLRFCSQQSRSLTRQLAAHQNLQWAFKNITPHPTQYPAAVEELFRLMTLFAARPPDLSEVEQQEVSTFRRTTLSAYLTGLDARVSWGTLINALRILVENEEDRLFVVYNGGIEMCFDALHTLHSMYHEATACHVSGDLLELLTELVLLVSALRTNTRTDNSQKKRQHIILKGLPEAVKRLASFLNTYNPPEIRNLSLDVLNELIRCSHLDVTNILAPIFGHCHISAQNSPQSIGPIGPYFPRRGTKVQWHSLSKNTPRPPRPMFQMSIPQNQIIQKGIDSDFDAQLEAFYKPYHDCLDIMMRMAVNTNQLNESLVQTSCLAAIEAAPLHFNFFPKFWVGIHNNRSTHKYVELLLSSSGLADYIDILLRDERVSINDQLICNFLEMYYPKIISKLTLSRQIYAIGQTLQIKTDLGELSGDLHAIRIIIESSASIPSAVRKQLAVELKDVLSRNKIEALDKDETPPKKKVKITLPDNISNSETSDGLEESSPVKIPEDLINKPGTSTNIEMNATMDESTTAYKIDLDSANEKVELDDIQPKNDSAKMAGTSTESNACHEYNKRHIESINKYINIILGLLHEHDILEDDDHSDHVSEPSISATTNTEYEETETNIRKSTSDSEPIMQ